MAVVSNLEAAQIRNALPHQLQIHFHEVVLDSTRFCRGKDFFPVERALPYGHDLLVFADQPCTCIEMKRPGYLLK